MVRNYLIVTASYWGFTLVDGALRMLVLFHFFRLGYTPFTLAFLFLLYEAAGIGANLAGGYFASRFGIPRMLAVGQMLQIAGLLCCRCYHAQQISALLVPETVTEFPADLRLDLRAAEERANPLQDAGLGPGCHQMNHLGRWSTSTGR